MKQDDDVWILETFYPTVLALRMSVLHYLLKYPRYFISSVSEKNKYIKIDKLQTEDGHVVFYDKGKANY